jgi:hypothetical protein
MRLIWSCVCVLFISNVRRKCSFRQLEPALAVHVVREEREKEKKEREKGERERQREEEREKEREREGGE